MEVVVCGVIGNGMHEMTGWEEDGVDVWNEREEI